MMKMRVGVVVVKNINTDKKFDNFKMLTNKNKEYFNINNNNSYNKLEYNNKRN